MNIGLKIKKLRHQKSATQEELASFVSVSTQAVSKWENGGTPDIELLPKIAEYFEVSIDVLFDLPVRDIYSIEERLEKYFCNIPNQERYFKAMDLFWKISNCIIGNDEINDLSDIISKDSVSHMDITQPGGTCLMRMASEETFFFIAPYPTNGYNYLLHHSDDYIKAFGILGNKDIFDAIVLLYKRVNRNFTAKLFIKEMGVSNSRAEEIIIDLGRLNLITVTEIELDNEIQKTYSLNKNTAIIGLLAFADMIVKRPNIFNNYYGDSNTFYFK